MGKKEFETVSFDEKNHALVILDQTKLPNSIEMLTLKTKEEIWNAIHLLQVRGAPAIGVAAAIGIAVLSETIQSTTYEDFYQQFQGIKKYLNSSRPTAVNLSWALERMAKVCQLNAEKNLEELQCLLLEEALRIKEEDIEVCRAIGEFGLTLVKKGDGLLTHCNAGRLATIRYGTATAPMYLGHERGYDFKVFVDETRPLLQGARLTAFELLEAGIDMTLICDNMSASVMRKGLVNAVFVGCDRVAANGDVANKIGTSMVAISAKRYGIPFYVCAPTSTIDMATPKGAEIVIEERKDEEITEMWYQKRMAPDGIKVFNPSFDVTDHDLITGIVTELGILRAPYRESLLNIFTKKYSI